MKKGIKQILSAVVAVIMLLSSMPFSAFAAPASDLPDNMVDSPILRALEYTGYDVQKQKDDGTLYQSGSYGSRAPEEVRSNIGYSTTLSGMETVEDSSTKTGLAPDIEKFEELRGVICLLLYKEDDSFLVFTMIICLFFSVVFAIGIVFFTKNALSSLRESIPVSVIFWCLTAFCLVLMLFTVSIGLSNGITYVQVKNRDFITIEGQVTLLNAEEEYHRDSFLGYSVVLSVDGEEFVPDTIFPEDITDIFKSDRKLQIYYIESNGEIIVYEIRACD